ncbi:MAG TPA: hypothetical protein VFL80_09315 [Thermoanaerobaculia bacterium]|nr:hypothetical protein [Thermoanaerobaculia bacterium]
MHSLLLHEAATAARFATYTLGASSMSDPVLSLVLVLSLPFAVLIARFFRSLETDGWQALRTPLAAGAAAGVALRLLDERASGSMTIAAGVLLTVAAWYARLTGHESDPVDGMLLGSAGGATAALPLAVDSSDPCAAVASCVAAGAVAGYGVTFAALYTASRPKQLLLDLVTAAVAVIAAFVPSYLRSTHGVTSPMTAMIIAASVPLLAILAVFVEWPHVRSELREESSHGLMTEEDARLSAHPLLRLGRGGWGNAEAHRQFVRLGNKLARRKRQQRRRNDDLARIYQLEIIKLRMQMQQMHEIGRASSPATQMAEFSSDRMPRSE